MFDEWRHLDQAFDTDGIGNHFDFSCHSRQGIDLGVSTRLHRHWYRHDPIRMGHFQKRFREEEETTGAVQ